MTFKNKNLFNGEIKMKKILFILTMIVFSAGLAQAVVNLDNGDYSNLFSYANALDDAESFSDVTIGSRWGLRIAVDGHVLYKFTRTDVTKVGLVVLKARDDVFDNSWFVIGWGTDPSSLTENNLANLGGQDRHNIVQIPIPIGEDTFYVKARHINNYNGWLRYIKAYADMNSYNSNTINGLECGSPFVDPCDDQEATDAVAYSSANCNTVAYDASPTDPLRGVALNYPSSDGVRYRFTGTAAQIANTYFTFTGLDNQSGNGSWFNIQINDFDGNELLSTNLTNLANPDSGAGRHTFTINLADIPALAGATEFELHFFNSCCAGTGDPANVRLIYLEVGVDPLIGDFNSDCDVDLLDMSMFSEAWTGS
jgi:hypothetical protein